MIVDALIRKLLSGLSINELEWKRGFTHNDPYTEFWKDREYYEKPTVTAAYRYHPSCKYVYKVIKWKSYSFFKHWRSYTLIFDFEKNKLYVTYDGYNTYTTRLHINEFIGWVRDVYASSKGLYIREYCNKDVIKHYVMLDLNDKYYGYRKEVIRSRAIIKPLSDRFWQRIFSMPLFNPSKWDLKIGIAKRTWGEEVVVSKEGVSIPRPWCFHIVNNTFYVLGRHEDLMFRASIHRSLHDPDVLIGKIVAIQYCELKGKCLYRRLRDVAIIGRENGIWFTIHVPPIMATARLDKLEKWCFGIDNESYLYAQA